MVKGHKRSHPQPRTPYRIKKYPHRVYPGKKKGKAVITFKNGYYPRDVDVKMYDRGGKIHAIIKPKHAKGVHKAKKTKTGKRTKYTTKEWMAKIRKMRGKKGHKKRKK